MLIHRARGARGPRLLAPFAGQLQLMNTTLACPRCDITRTRTPWCSYCRKLLPPLRKQSTRFPWNKTRASCSTPKVHPPPLCRFVDGTPLLNFTCTQRICIVLVAIVNELAIIVADDDTLAGYAEVASRLVKPSPLHLPAHRPRNRSADPSRRLFYDDDVRHENLNSHSYEVDSLDTSSSAAGSAHAEGLSQTRAASQDPQGYSMPVDFSSAEAGIGPSSWAPEDPVVEPWQAHQNIDRQLGDLHSNSNGISHNDSPSSPGGKSAAAERSQSRGRAFSPSGSHGRHSGSASPKVHNGSIHRSPRAHNGASAGPEHQPVGSSSPDRGVNGSVRVSNGAHPRSSREARSEQRRASGRDIRSQSLPASPPEEPAEQPVADPAPQTLGFWDQQSSPATAPGSSSTQSDNNGTSSVGHGQQHRSRDALEGPVRREDGRSTEAPGRARPFFSSQMPAAVDQHGRPQREHEFTSADPTEPFFDINPTVPEGYKAGIPVHYPRRPVPRRPAGSKPSAPDARRKGSLQTEFPVKANGSQNGYQAEVDCDDLDQAKSEVAAQGDTAQLDGMLDHDPRNGSDKILESPNDHASRSFARAVSHSSLPSAMPGASHLGVIGTTSSAFCLICCDSM